MLAICDFLNSGKIWCSQDHHSLINRFIHFQKQLTDCTQATQTMIQMQNFSVITFKHYKQFDTYQRSSAGFIGYESKQINDEAFKLSWACGHYLEKKAIINVEFFLAKASLFHFENTLQILSWMIITNSNGHYPYFPRV